MGSHYEKKDNYTDEQLYELWWNYLKLSDDYKEFCEIMRSISDKEAEDVDEQIEKKYIKRHPHSKINFDYKYYYDHQRNWQFMGDVHKKSFSDWWNTFSIPNKKPSIINLKDTDVETAFPFYKLRLNVHKRRKKYPPHPKEVINYLVSSDRYLFVAIPITQDLKNSEINKTITHMRKDARKKNMGTFQRMECQFSRPLGTIRYGELKKYCDIYYKLYIQKMKPKVVQRQTNVTDSSQFTKHKNKARIIIKNVEKGIFPGNEYWGK